MGPVTPRFCYAGGQEIGAYLFIIYAIFLAGAAADPRIFHIRAHLARPAAGNPCAGSREDPGAGQHNSRLVCRIRIVHNLAEHHDQSKRKIAAHDKIYNNDSCRISALLMDQNLIVYLIGLIYKKDPKY